jgi:hypothetical protein
MTEFSDQNRDKPMWHTVSFHDVPMFRALALALDHAQDHGAVFAILSADRRDSVIQRFNAENHTSLHGQEYLFENQGKPGFNPADRPGTTSHCLFSDGNPAYQVGGRLIPAGGKLPNYMLGIDAVDHGSQTDCSILLNKLHSLGYHVVRPYHSGSEAHHMSFVTNPIHTLKVHNRVPHDTPESDE